MAHGKPPLVKLTQQQKELNLFRHVDELVAGKAAHPALSGDLKQQIEQYLQTKVVVRVPNRRRVIRISRHRP